MESFHEAWDLICDYCKAHITDVAYKTWISRIEPVKLDFDAGDAILMVPNEFHRQTLNRCYMPLLNSAVHEIFGSGINIIFTIPNEAGEKKAAPNDNLAIDSEYEFTFDTYIVGSSNKFAHAASLAVAANPAGAYNPLFDRPPKEIQTLEDRLRTRFEWGLIADIQPPDFETRIAIIKRKAEALDLELPGDVCEYIATRLKTNIRQLEGAVKKMKANWLLNGDAPTMANAQTAISDILNNDQPPPLTVEKIIEEVGRTFEVSPDDIRSSKRSANISNARQIAVYVVREITQLSMTTIGEEFGGRDHSTVVYAVQQVEKNMKKDSKTKAMVEDIIKNIRDR